MPEGATNSTSRAPRAARKQKVCAQLGGLIKQACIDLLVPTPPGLPQIYGEPVVTGNVTVPQPWAVTAIDTSFSDGRNPVTFNYVNTTIWCANAVEGGKGVIARAKHAAAIDGAYNFTTATPQARGGPAPRGR
jgi:hypothetical protein